MRRVAQSIIFNPSKTTDPLIWFSVSGADVLNTSALFASAILRASNIAIGSKTVLPSLLCQLIYTFITCDALIKSFQLGNASTEKDRE